MCNRTEGCVVARWAWLRPPNAWVYSISLSRLCKSTDVRRPFLPRAEHEHRKACKSHQRTALFAKSTLCVCRTKFLYMHTVFFEIGAHSGRSVIRGSPNYLPFTRCVCTVRTSSRYSGHALLRVQVYEFLHVVCRIGDLSRLQSNFSRNAEIARRALWPEARAPRCQSASGVPRPKHAGMRE